MNTQGPAGMELSPPPSGLEAEYEALFTTDSLLFLHELISTFDGGVDEVGQIKNPFFKIIIIIIECMDDLWNSIQVLRLRVSRKAHLDLSGELPSFQESTTYIRRDPDWRVLPVPPRLQRRYVDVGDLAPCDTERFIKALQSPAQGIQVPPLTCDYMRQAHPLPVRHVAV